MLSGPILSSAVNVSEGRRPEVIDALAGEASEHARVLDVSPDPDHNRTVITVCGPSPELIQALVAMAEVAVRRIDLRDHQGAHPRLGAVDVVPFTPRFDSTMAEADAAARRCAELLWSRLAIPCFLYEGSASSPGRAALPAIRREAFKTILPDLGGPAPHPSAGAAVVGARGPLVAFNVNLDSDDLESARAIAAAVRSQAVRALGLKLESRQQVQVSMNLVRPAEVTVWDAFGLVEKLARARAIDVESSELVGVVDRAHLGIAEVDRLALRSEPVVFEELLRKPNGRG